MIGGTGFIGSYLVRLLAGMGHSVGVFHRGKSRLDLPAEHIFGDWHDLPKLKLKTDIVVDLILASGAQARELMAAFHGRARRVIAASSAGRLSCLRNFASAGRRSTRPCATHGGIPTPHQAPELPTETDRDDQKDGPVVG